MNMATQAKTKEVYHKVRVHWLNGDKHEISVNPNGDRRAFMPGVEVILSESHIGVLKEAIIEHEIPINPDSAIYQAPNPLVAAREQNPGFGAKRDEATGEIFLVKREPRFSIEQVE